MLKNIDEIEIISKAQQVNIRNPDRSREPFFRILEDFFDLKKINNTKVLDLGPGQFDFGEILKVYNSIVNAIDFDPAVIELGKMKGFKTFNIDMAKIEQFSLDNKKNMMVFFVNILSMLSGSRVQKK
jgi:2-polyprenyl-3-methyl-5-hydroxy-6-metoxy-1,4-benzoquinol methylase